MRPGLCFVLRMEEKVGIEGFISTNTPITRGILKHLCSDFIVEEIGLDGSIAERNGSKFLDHSLEEQMIYLQKETEQRHILKLEERAKKRAMSEEEKDEELSKKKEKDLQRFDELKKQLPSIIFREDDFISFLFGESNLYLSEKIDEKSNRTLIHQKIRQIFEGTLLTECPSDNKIKITRRFLFPSAAAAATTSGKEGYRDFEKQADQYPFLQFCLTKIGMDTGEVINELERKVKIKNCFSVAGSKDRRAITCQFVHARNMTPRRLLGLVNKSSINDRKDHRIISVTGIKVVDNPLKMGDLRGNRFRMVIRDISQEDGKDLKERINKFNKFINYFGLQRFGNRQRVPSHQLGIALLRKEWQCFLSLLLDPIDGEEDGFEEVRKWWKEGASNADIPFIPRRFVAEREVISVLGSPSSISSDLANKAIRAIPRELRMMYAHSLQSFIWNKVATRRIERDGLLVVVGKDLVSSTDDGNIIISNNFSALKDIVLPVPGYDSIYPENTIMDYLEVSREIGIISKDDTIEHLSSFFKSAGDCCGLLSGAYRPLFVIKEEMNLKAEVIPYLLCDEEIDWNFSDPIPPSSEYLSLVLSFSLPSSSYATMFLREIFHSTTDPLYHKLKSKSH